MSAGASPPADSRVAWIRASLNLAILTVLTEGDRHGYALAQRITELGLTPVRGGALYPVLGRLESDGFIESLWQAGDGGPGKKVYSLTQAGHRRLDTERAAWREFSVALEGLLGATTQEQT